MNAPRSRRTRGATVFLGWTTKPGRQREMALHFGGEAVVVFPDRLRAPRLKLLRYVVSIFLTAYELGRRRPSAVVAVNPPIFPGLAALALRPLLRHRVILDSHPGGFGAQGDRWSARMQWAHRFVVRRADLVLVASEPWLEVVEQWGGRGLVFHEAPGDWTAPSRPAPRPRPRVLFVGIFAPDEPVAELLAAARQVPQIDIHVTGDPAVAPAGLLSDLPDNVRLVGWLDQAQYRQAICDADVVMTLTTEHTSVPRSGCEAVYAGRSLIISDWPVLRAAFPYAVHVGHDPDDLARGIRLAVTGPAGPATSTEAASTLQLSRWEQQRTALLAALAGGNGPHDTGNQVISTVPSTGLR